MNLEGLSLLVYVEQFFNDMEWDIHKGYESRFNCFVDRLMSLKDEEKDLIFEITKDFLDIKDSQYEQLFWESYDLVPENIKDDVEHIVFTPCNTKLDTKSADHLFYKMKSKDYKMIRHYEKFKFIGKSKDINQEISKNYLVIIIDDFIGSGNTVKTFLNSKAIDLSKGNVCILCLACQEDGKKYLKSEFDLNVYSTIIRKKGLSDKYTGCQLTKNVELMKKIEEVMFSSSFLKNNSFGRFKSEALINFLGKCPNNTFPFYWAGKKSPFPRNK